MSKILYQTITQLTKFITKALLIQITITTSTKAILPPINSLK